MNPMNPAMGMFNPASPHYYITGPGAYQHQSQVHSNPQTSANGEGDVGFAFVLLIIFLVATSLVIAGVYYMYKD